MSSKNKIIGVGCFLIFLFILSVIYLCLPKTSIVINGEKNIDLLLGDVYQEEGALASIKTLFNTKELDVEISGNVNTEKIGKYIITYRTKTNEKIRIVNVIDNIKPEIFLQGEVIGCKNKNLIEYKIKATDNYDGDISEKIKYKIDDDKITFSVIDSSKNESIIEKRIKYVDDEKPNITLNGDKEIYLLVGDAYIEQGANASDSCDGNITSKIKINHNIDTSIPGTYEVIYKVLDSDGNEEKCIRKVIVKEITDDFKSDFQVIHGATIYLTFDDGPGPYTEELLDILDKYDVKATFFVTGQFPKYQHLISEEYKRGHSIGIHTYTHKWSIYQSVEEYLNDFTIIDNIIYEETGVHTKIFRFPGGSSNTISRNYSEGIMTKLSKIMEEKGYIYFDWTFDSGDTAKNNNSSETIIKNVKSNLKGDGDYIILMHDIKENTLKALPQIIEFAKTNGYEFSKLTESSPVVHLKIAN